MNRAPQNILNNYMQVVVDNYKTLQYSSKKESSPLLRGDLEEGKSNHALTIDTMF